MSEESLQKPDIDLATAAALAATTLQLAASETNERAVAPGGFVPSLAEQAATPNLPGEFDYIPREKPRLDDRRPGADVHMSESEGLEKLTTFLHDFINTTGQSASEENAQLAEQATDILENGNYVGEQQLALATSWMAESWKEYLRNNPSAELYLWGKNHKSSGYLLNRALGNFTPKEREEFAGRLEMVNELTETWPTKEVRKLPDQYKIVMVDDTIGTGRQLSNAYSHDIALAWQYPEPPNVEVNLVIATDDMLQNGFITNSSMSGIHLPVQAFYQARPAKDGGNITTFIHSSTDDRFEVPIGNMIHSLRTTHAQPDAVMPPLTNITRQYHNSPLGQIPEKL